ncbi:PAS domain S-box protein [Desulfuromonas sp.]|uniref:PAS domain-containing sensor histidine kinase n=1 Tax=Desulfuromonas sp. TaxID=892 RepID=UPI0025C0A031|nr:PAS domain S-box protein [Desulfuromonas sp.]
MTNPMPSALFETMVSNISTGLYVVQDEKAIYLNDHFGRYFGYDSVASLIGRNLFEEVYPDRSTADFFRGIHKQMLERSSAEVSWAQLSTRCDGTPFWLEVEARLIEVEGRPAIMGTFKDQTECQLIAEAMHVSQGTLREVLDAMEDRVYVVDEDYRIVYANRKMQQGVLADIDNEPCYRVCRGLEEVCDDCTKDLVFSSDQPIYKEIFNLVTKKWFSVIEMAIRMPGHGRPTKLAVARDITSRKEDEERIRRLSHRLMNAQEDERKRLSREIHDDLGQRLNAMKISVGTLAEDLEGQTPELRQRVRALNAVLQDTIESARQISAGLRPPVLERLGLVQTIRDHCEKLAVSSGLKIHFKAPGMRDFKLDNASEIKLFRVVQEALHNVVKHAEASAVSIHLVASYPSIRLKIEDDGVGFDYHGRQFDCDPSEHLGLVGMKERVDILGGRLDIRSAAGEGTRIVVEVPCPNDYAQVGNE